MHFVILLNKVDIHSVHFHGQILTAQKRHTDTVSLSPGASTTAEMMADNVGHWLLTCTVNDHLMGKVTHKHSLMFFSAKCIVSVPLLEMNPFFVLCFGLFSWNASHI